SRKWPARRAPDRRNSSSVRLATAARVEASSAGLIVVIGSSVGSRSVFDALRGRRAGLAGQRRPDELVMAAQPATAALPGELVDEPDRQRPGGAGRPPQPDRH